MASFSVKSFERKLKEMSARQDSVQTVSLWLIHHRAHSKIVVSVWLDRMKKAKPDRRLVLFYLANDVIQNSRKKGKEFSQSFKQVLGDSMQYLRDTSIRPSVDRVLKIWQERKVFDKTLVQKLLDELNNASAKPKVKAKAKPKPETSVVSKKDSNDKVEKKKKPKRPIPANFKTVKVTSAIATMQGIEDETERRQTLVKQMRLDASSSEGIKQLKDYAGGNRFSLEFEESSTKYEDLVQSLEHESQQRQILISLLEDGDSYYNAALKEASIIANAYRSFGNRLHSMKKKLDNKIRKFATAEKEAPVSAPKASFLGSGLSGILESMNQSPAGTPSRSEQEKSTNEGDKMERDKKENDEAEKKVTDPSVDHVEVSDMDLDSDSENGGDNAGPSAAPQLSDTNSNTSSKSTPKPSTSTAPFSNTLSPSGKPKVPVKIASTTQFGYTMTVDSINSTDDTETSSPASRTSAPSPDGSPDLNLEIYEGALGANALDGVVANQSFLSGDRSGDAPGAGGREGKTTKNVLANLIDKQRENDGTSGEGTPEGDFNMVDHNKPYQQLLGAMYSSPSISSSTPADASIQLGEISQSEVSQYEGNIEGSVLQEAIDQQYAQNVNAETVITAANSGVILEPVSKLDSGPSTDEEGAADDNTPEHGLDFNQAPSLSFDSSFPRPPIPPTLPGLFPGQFQNRPPRATGPFTPRERMPGFANEPGMFLHDGPRRRSLEEQMMEEHNVHEIRSPASRSPRMQGRPMEWERRQHFGHKGNIRPSDNVAENRDPRLRRRGQRSEPFMDGVPPIEMRGRPPGIGRRGSLEFRRDPLAEQNEDHFVSPMGAREELRRSEMDLMRTDKMIRRRLSVGDERDGNIGHPPMQTRPDLRQMEGRPPMDMRERLHAIERDVPHYMDEPVDREGPYPRLRNGPPIMREEIHEGPHQVNPNAPSLHQDASYPMERGNEFHPPKMIGGPTDEVPTSEEESPVGDETLDPFSGAGASQIEGTGEVYFPDGGEQLPVNTYQQIEGNRFHDFTEDDSPPLDFQNEHPDAAMFSPDGRHTRMRPPRSGFHTDRRDLPDFGRGNGNRPVSTVGGQFRPRHRPHGRFGGPGPRNFRPRNFGPRDFRPRFPPMRGGGPRLKRSGPPFYGDPAKRPHY